MAKQHKDHVVQLAAAAGRAASEIETGVRALCAAAGGLEVVSLVNLGTTAGRQFVCVTVGNPPGPKQPHLTPDRIRNVLDEKAAAYGLTFIGYVP